MSGSDSDDLVAGSRGQAARLKSRDMTLEGAKYGMGSRKHLAPNRWERARKGLLQKERWDSCRES